MTILAWCIAWVLDFIIGDPQHWPHPVRWIGRLITFVQRIVRRYCHSDKALRIGGGVMWIVVVGATWGMAWAYWRWRSGFIPGLAGASKSG
ncbi:cobalamin biosynthesis protein [Salmonella enterica subsp. diarizonae]|uniref:Cobalamin biosynthesis protein n=1 Tax=Salmonella diarizonae TaxID=59204 RepID=A0A379TWV9_SALDZ|nr:cobalamin biosynthesis protein [Salmonella enterica subsp. diarizonae]